MDLVATKILSCVNHASIARDIYYDNVSKMVVSTSPYFQESSMEHLGDVGQVDAHFDLFGDSVNLSARSENGFVVLILFFITTVGVVATILKMVTSS